MSIRLSPSSLITSAPRSDRIRVQVGPAYTCVRSNTRTPSRGRLTVRSTCHSERRPHSCAEHRLSAKESGGAGGVNILPAQPPRLSPPTLDLLTSSSRNPPFPQHQLVLSVVPQFTQHFMRLLPQQRRSTHPQRRLRHLERVGGQWHLPKLRVLDLLE